jgi:hypothetical protein
MNPAVVLAVSAGVAIALQVVANSVGLRDLGLGALIGISGAATALAGLALALCGKARSYRPRRAVRPWLGVTRSVHPREHRAGRQPRGACADALAGGRLTARLRAHDRADGRLRSRRPGRRAPQGPRRALDPGRRNPGRQVLACQHFSLLCPSALSRQAPCETAFWQMLPQVLWSNEPLYPADKRSRSVLTSFYRQLLKYSTCSSVSRSGWTPKVVSLVRAMYSSISPGIVCRPGGILSALPAR